MSSFSLNTRGLVSYLNTDTDATRFPKVTFLTHQTVMSGPHYTEYAKKYGEDVKKKTPKVPFAL